MACFRVLAAKIGDLPVTIITVRVFIKPFEPEYSRQINFCSGCLELVFWFRARIVCKLSQKKCIKVNKSANKCKKVVGFAVQVCSGFL